MEGLEEEKKGGREMEGARDWLPLPAPSHLTASLSASQSGAAAVFERCQREEEEEEEFKKKKDKCAAGVDVQRLQFVKTETCFLNLVFFHSGSALRVYPAAGSWLMRLHHMVASLPHMGGTAPDSSEHLPVLFELLNKVYSAVNVCTERGVSERGDLSPCEPWVLVNHVIN